MSHTLQSRLAAAVKCERELAARGAMPFTAQSAFNGPFRLHVTEEDFAKAFAGCEVVEKPHGGNDNERTVDFMGCEVFCLVPSDTPPKYPRTITLPPLDPEACSNCDRPLAAALYGETLVCDECADAGAVVAAEGGA